MHLSGYHYNTIYFIHPELTQVDQSNNWILSGVYFLEDLMESNVGYADLGNFVVHFF